MKCLFFILCVVLSLLDGSASFKQSRVLGGKNAKDGQFPYLVSLRRAGKHYCAGSILGARWVITAAHCTHGVQDVVEVVSGSRKLSSGGTIHYVDFFVEYAQFDFHNMIHDLALIKVLTPFVFDANTKPIALDLNYYQANIQMVFAGWGYTKYPSTTMSDKLQFVDLPSLDNLDCSHRLNKQIYTSQICTLAKRGVGTCQGDSGGPLVYNGHLVGVISYGTPCAIGYPDVFTRIQYYHTWINAEMTKYGL